jgi:Flp pilus assembly protein TadG
MSLTSIARRAVKRAQIRALACLCRLREAREGVAAVEFALIVPIMVFMFIGAVEMSQAVTVDRRVSQVAATTGDLVARIDSDITQDEVLDIAKVGSYLMNPFTGSAISINLSVITSTAASATNTTERWRCTFAGSLPSSINCTCPLTAYTIPTGLIGTSDGVVIADVTYSYKPLIYDFFLKQAQPSGTGVYSIKEKLHVKPRAVCPKLKKNDGTTCSCF